MLSSACFLAGGVSTYLAPWLMAPLYIAGSTAMLTSTTIGLRSGSRRPRTGSALRAELAWWGAGLIAVAALAFWFGYLMERIG